MTPVVTEAIVLNRVNYGEADRILTLLTPTHGKLSVIAKGVRKSKSKLAGGIELFSVSSISYIVGKKDIHTLISTRLQHHYGDITKDLQRSDLAFTCLKLFNAVTADNPDKAYFDLLQRALAYLDQAAIACSIIELWLYAHLLRLEGHSPQLGTDVEGRVLEEGQQYDFQLAAMAFKTQPDGVFTSAHIKLLRLARQLGAERLAQLEGANQQVADSLQLLRLIIKDYYHK